MQIAIFCFIQQVKFYNEFGEKATKAGVPKPPSGKWKLQTADEYIAARAERRKRKKLKKKKTSQRYR